MTPATASSSVEGHNPSSPSPHHRAELKPLVLALALPPQGRCLPPFTRTAAWLTPQPEWLPAPATLTLLASDGHQEHGTHPRPPCVTSSVGSESSRGSGCGGVGKRWSWHWVAIVGTCPGYTIYSWAFRGETSMTALPLVCLRLACHSSVPMSHPETRPHCPRMAWEVGGGRPSLQEKEGGEKPPPLSRPQT